MTGNVAALTVAGATTLLGTVALGDATTDTVTMTGNVAAVTVAGATTMLGTIALGDAKTDTITIYGNVVGDSTQNPKIDFSGSSGAVTFGGDVTVAGATTLQG